MVDEYGLTWEQLTDEQRHMVWNELSADHETVELLQSMYIIQDNGDIHLIHIIQ